MGSEIRVLHTIGLGLLVWLCTSPVLAQATAIDDARKNARLRFRGVYLTPTLQLKEFGLDSNVFNIAGEQTPDFTVTLSPGTDVAVPFAHRALVTGHVDADLVYYQQYSDQRSINPDVSLRATLFVRRLSIFTGGNITNTRRRVNQEIDARARRIERGTETGFNLRLSAKVTAGLSGREDHVVYDAGQFFRGVGLRDALSHDSRTLAAHASYKATPKTTFVVRADGGRERLPFSPIKNADTFRITPGVEFQPRALIAGTAYVGIRRFDPLSPVVPQYRGAVASVSLSYSIVSATKFTVLLARDVEYSYQEIEPYYISTSFSLSVRRQLIGPFDTIVGFQRYHNDYQDLVTSPQHTEPPRIDETRNYTADVGYRIGRKGRLGVGASYWTRDSNRVQEVAYEGFRFGSTLSYGF
jgi:putative beta-barrel porin BBP2